jgi:hypothetical protein
MEIDNQSVTLLVLPVKVAAVGELLQGMLVVLIR